MRSIRSHSLLDKLIDGSDRALRTLVPGASTNTVASPSDSADMGGQLTDDEAKHAAALMRINHTGEVCAQALYQGQAATADLFEVREKMQHAADEEIEHLAWCEKRIEELGGRPSLLNPAFYAMSFAMGAIAGKLGDKYSLGFVAATEDKVCEHLESHLRMLPENDTKSRAIVEQMIEDEARHADMAIDAGGIEFNTPAKAAMALMSKVMTASTYRI